VILYPSLNWHNLELEWRTELCLNRNSSRCGRHFGGCPLLDSQRGENGVGGARPLTPLKAGFGAGGGVGGGTSCGGTDIRKTEANSSIVIDKEVSLGRVRETLREGDSGNGKDRCSGILSDRSSQTAPSGRNAFVHSKGKKDGGGRGKIRLLSRSQREVALSGNLLLEISEGGACCKNVIGDKRRSWYSKGE